MYHKQSDAFQFMEHVGMTKPETLSPMRATGTTHDGAWSA